MIALFWNLTLVSAPALLFRSSRPGHGRKVEPSPGTPGTSGTLGTPGTLGSQYLRIPWTPGTPRTSGPSDPRGPQNLRTLWKLPLSFEIQNLITVQSFLICCKKYRDEVSHRYGSVVSLAKV